MIIESSVTRIAIEMCAANYCVAEQNTSFFKCVNIDRILRLQPFRMCSASEWSEIAHRINKNEVEFFFVLNFVI